VADFKLKKYEQAIKACRTGLKEKIEKDYNLIDKLKKLLLKSQKALQAEKVAHRTAEARLADGMAQIEAQDYVAAAELFTAGLTESTRDEALRTALRTARAGLESARATTRAAEARYLKGVRSMEARHFAAAAQHFKTGIAELTIGSALQQGRIRMDFGTPASQASLASGNVVILEQLQAALEAAQAEQAERLAAHARARDRCEAGLAAFAKRQFGEARALFEGGLAETLEVPKPQLTFN
jgi:hypothetical protein